MSKVWRALLISAAATGAFAAGLAVYQRFSASKADPSEADPLEAFEVDADAMSEDQQNALLEELEAQL